MKEQEEGGSRPGGGLTRQLVNVIFIDFHDYHGGNVILCLGWRGGGERKGKEWEMNTCRGASGWLSGLHTIQVDFLFCSKIPTIVLYTT